MITRPDLADVPVGANCVIDGVPMVHMGGGRFQPALVGDPLAKRFDVNEGEPLHRLVA